MKHIITYFLLISLCACKTSKIAENQHIFKQFEQFSILNSQFSIPCELTIKTLSYKENDKLPTPEKNCIIKIELLQPDSYSVNKLILHDTITGHQITLTPENKLLHFGHQAIKATKNGKTATSEIIYKGGSIQLNLTIK
jgi:hypothetical protein